MRRVTVRLGVSATVDGQEHKTPRTVLNTKRPGVADGEGDPVELYEYAEGRANDFARLLTYTPYRAKRLAANSEPISNDDATPHHTT